MSGVRDDVKVARRSPVTDGSGYVFWNPDSGEEYNSDHPVHSGTCEDAERIRHSTRQEDCLHAAVQAHWHAADASRKERDALAERVRVLESALDAAVSRAAEAEAKVEELDDHVERVERLLIMARPLLVTHRSWKSAPIVEKIDNVLKVNWEKQPDAAAALSSNTGNTP